MSAKSQTKSVPDIERISEALGPVSALAYSPPHDYPMSVPKLDVKPCVERERLNFDQMRLYVHIPFCNYACTFCFFAKNVGSTHNQMKRYVHALKKEIEWIRPGTRISQLFVGGGTPTVLPAELLDDVLMEIFDRMPCDGKQVHTVETSPESISKEHIQVLQKHKIGRVSMGIQSLEERVLDTVNRRHKIGESLEACNLLVKNGFIVNVDLMFGLPDQTHESFRRDLEVIASHNIHSFTLYNLRIHPSTPMAKTLDTEQTI